jgi:hypothetical protein
MEEQCGEYLLRSAKILKASSHLLRRALVITIFVFNCICFAQNEYPSGMTPVGDRVTRQKLLNILKGDSATWEDALSIYYSDARDRRLPNLVFFIDSNETVHTSLIEGGDCVNVLSGEQRFWVIIFSEHQYPEKSDTETTKLKIIYRGKDTTITAEKTMSSFSLRVTRETTVQLPSPTMGTILNMLDVVVAKIAGITPSSPINAATLDYSESLMDLKFFGDLKTDSLTPLYYGTAGFTLAPNTYIRVVVRPSDSRKYRSFHENFVNTEGNFYGTSVGVNLYGPNDLDSLKWRPSLLILGNLNFRQPRKPIDSRTYGLAFGLALINTSDPFANFFIGGRFSLSWLPYYITKIWRYNDEKRNSYYFDEKKNFFGDGGFLFGLTLGIHIKPVFRLGIDMAL